MFESEKTIINYESLGLGRIIYQLPTTLCEMFLNEVFKKNPIETLDEDTLARYDAAAKRFGGLAVEKLEGNVPSVCRVKLQPSLFSDLKHAGSIAECPYCHRLLVTEEVAD